MTQTRVLVTGAGGNVGRPLIDELAASGTPARAAYRSADKTARAKAAGRDAVTVDYSRPETVSSALDGVDAVFLLATGVQGQIEGETNVVRAAKAADLRKFVYWAVTQGQKFGPPLLFQPLPVPVQAFAFREIKKIQAV